MELIKEIGAFAGLASFLGLAVLALLSFAQGRDIRRLREWAGSAPERDQERKETTSAVAAQRAEELRKLEQARRMEQEAAALRDMRRRRREAGLPELTRWEKLRATLPAGRAAALAGVALAVIVALAVAFVVISPGGSDDGGGHGKKGAGRTALRPGDIEVSVLNGTAVSGLAGRIGDKVERKGYKLGAVTNTESSFETSVVMYPRGRAPEARKVARVLGIDKVRPRTQEIAAVSAGATVSVVVGEDHAAANG